MTRSSKKAHAKQDRRVGRTRHRLVTTLRQLFQEKPLTAITVQDVLDNSGVSRSTFYAHFDDIEDLFLTDMDEFLERVATGLTGAGDKSERLAPVREFFTHVGDARHMRLALARSDRLLDFFELARVHFARGIESRLAEVAGSKVLPETERAVLAHALAGALIAQLEWWNHHRTNISAERMDAWFHRLAWAGIRAAADDKG
jgi:AcrR family transcriptional regulator